MANMTEKMARDTLRDLWVAKFVEFLEAQGEEVLRTKSNEVCIPALDGLDLEQFVRITISVPTGSKGEEYDAYELAEEYTLKCKDKEEKAAARAKAKAEKIARDEARRAKKAAEKAEAKA